MERKQLEDALSRAAGGVGTGKALEDVIRSLVREEIASLAGKALRRTQDESLTRNPIHNEAEAAANAVAGHFWGEVLAEYGPQ